MDFLQDAADTNIEDFSILNQNTFNIKFGIDPTSDFIHLGHIYILSKLKEFINLGHTVTIVIGDYTALVGDPTGRDSTRPVLTQENIKQNCTAILNQIQKYLGSENINIVYNSSWYKEMNVLNLLELSSKVNFNQLSKRPDFHNRITNNISIQLHEFIYPVLQAYDSVYLKNDIEIGGSDQLFNIQLGSKFKDSNQKYYITFPILEGIDKTSRKMSKSYNNTINNKDTVQSIYYKVLNMPDEKLNNFNWILELTDKEDLVSYKKQLAFEIIKIFNLEVNENSLNTIEIDVTFNSNEIKIYELTPQIQSQLLNFSDHSFSKLIKQKSVKYKESALDFNTVLNVQDFPINLELTKKLKVILNYKQ